MSRFRARHHGLAQIAIVVAAVASYELLVAGAEAELAARARACPRGRVVGTGRAPGVGSAASTPLLAPAIARPRDERLLCRGPFRRCGRVLRLALPGRSPPAFRRLRNAFLAATAIALVVHWQFPTAPPRLAGIGLEDTLRRLSGIDIGSPGSGGLSDPVAAVPSLHAGWALGVAAGLILYARPLAWKAAGAAYPPAVVLTIIVTGNHFVFDALTGMLVMAAGFGFAVAAKRRPVLTFQLRRGVEQSGSSPGS